MKNQKKNKFLNSRSTRPQLTILCQFQNFVNIRQEHERETQNTCQQIYALPKNIHFLIDNHLIIIILMFVDQTLNMLHILSSTFQYVFIVLLFIHELQLKSFPIHNCNIFFSAGLYTYIYMHYDKA